MGGDNIPALSSRIADRWQFISFRGAGKGEWRGVVDLIAICKNTTQPTGDILKRGAPFDIVLIQIKGGSTPAPAAEDCLRLWEVKKVYHAKAVVQFQWRKGQSSECHTLGRNLQWKVTTGRALFE